METQSIFQFLVDDEGNIKNIKTFSRTGKDVRILRNEVYRVLEKLPQMVPGKNEENVSVPISRYIDQKMAGSTLFHGQQKTNLIFLLYLKKYTSLLQLLKLLSVKQ